MHNGEEVINLLTKSQRIFSDISMYFQYRVPGPHDTPTARTNNACDTAHALSHSRE